MAGFFYQLGRMTGSAWRKGRWVAQSVTGSEADSIEAEFSVGRELAREVAGEIGLEADVPTVRLLNGVGERLAGRLTNDRRQFTFTALKQAEVNAFALPGGFIFVTGPLLDLCGRDRDEVAFILGHEMGHVVRGHAMQRIVNNALIGAASRTIRGGGVVKEALKRAGAQLMQSAYTQDQELEVDAFGFRLAHSAGFDPAGGIRLLERLAATPHDDDAMPLAEYFASHPPMETRIDILRRLRRTE